MTSETTSTETYEYDGEGRQITKVYEGSGLTQTERYEYDDQGRQIKKTVVTING